MPPDLNEWVDRVFGPAIEPYQRLIGLDDAGRPGQAALQRLTKVFENPAILLEPYSDESLNRAFWDLSSGALHVLNDGTIEWASRHRLIQSFETLFRELFAVRCQPVLSHCSEVGSPINIACYMWWDFDCWTAAPEPLTRNPMDTAFLESMESILTIDHVACQESALHGLGHWHRAHGAAVEGIIDRFLKRERYLPARLRDYACSARCGCVQ